MSVVAGEVLEFGPTVRGVPAEGLERVQHGLTFLFDHLAAADYLLTKRHRKLGEYAPPQRSIVRDKTAATLTRETITQPNTLTLPTQHHLGILTLRKVKTDHYSHETLRRPLAEVVSGGSIADQAHTVLDLTTPSRTDVRYALTAADPARATTTGLLVIEGSNCQDRSSLQVRGLDASWDDVLTDVGDQQIAPDDDQFTATVNQHLKILSEIRTKINDQLPPIPDYHAQ